MNLHQSVAVVIQSMRDEATEIRKHAKPAGRVRIYRGVSASEADRLDSYAAELELALIEDSVVQSHQGK